MLGFMLSFYYVRRMSLAPLRSLAPHPPLFADSGAFTAWNKGESISVEEYASWLQQNQQLFPIYANLDVKGDVEAGTVNLVNLEMKGLHPMPVFHGGEPWSILEDFCARYDYIALGGIAGASMQAQNPKVLGWLTKCFEIAGDTKLHGFGMTNWEVVRRFPWHSIDSASIGSGYRFGQVNVWDPYLKRWCKWAVKDRKSWGQYGWLVRDYGLAPEDFAEPRTRPCTQALMKLASKSLARAVAEEIPSTQFYIVDDLGKQAGRRRIEVFSEANQEMLCGAQA